MRCPLDPREEALRQPMIEKSLSPPVFIVGCPRSGTTLLRIMLDSHPRISCGPEAHFVADMERITGRRWYQLEPFDRRTGSNESRGSSTRFRWSMQ